MLVGIERVIISMFIVVLLMIEFCSCIQQH